MRRFDCVVCVRREEEMALLDNDIVEFVVVLVDVGSDSRMVLLLAEVVLGVDDCDNRNGTDDDDDDDSDDDE